MSDLLEVCATCASLRIQVEAWVQVNGWKAEDVSRDGEAWCPTCEEHDVNVVHLHRVEGTKRWTITTGWRGSGIANGDQDAECIVRHTQHGGHVPLRIVGDHVAWKVSLQPAELPLRTCLRAVRLLAKATAAQ